MATGPPGSGGTSGGAEAAIRKIVAAENQGQPAPQMANRIFRSDAYKEPAVNGRRAVPATTTIGSPPEAGVFQKIVRTPVRIVVADSGDLAYEYEAAVLTITLTDGTSRTNDVSLIRVWQKDHGEWKLAVDFAAPYRK